MSKTPKVSIVSITYNHEKYIRDALDSFLMQETDFNFEIIIADDCSTDKTSEIIKEYAAAYPKIIKPILRKKNIGAIDNAIETLQAAKGEYIALCEGDDYWTDVTKLQRQVDFLDKHPAYAFCFHPVRVIFENREQPESVWPNIKDNKQLTVEQLLAENFVPTNAVMYRRQDYAKLPRNIMPLDWYFHSYHAQFGKIGYINRIMSAYRRHAGGLWWDSYSDTDNLWIKYGVANVAMYIELLKLYGDKPELAAIIYRSLARVMNTLIEVDQRKQSGLLKELVKTYPEQADVLLLGYNQQIRDDNQHTKNLNVEVDKLNREIIDLRSQVYDLRDQINHFTQSRVLGKIIKLRDWVGGVIPKIKHTPRYLYHKTRALVVGLTPKPIRQFLKKVRNYLRFLRDRRQYNKVVRKTVANEKWDPRAPLISVVIPYYNRHDTIDDTLLSLEAQTLQRFEIIIVDDGSTDPESVEKLEYLKKSGLRATIIHQDNQGVAIARNTGIAHAKGKYIICLDSDDVLEPTFIEKSTIVLETKPDIDLVTTNRQDFGVLTDEVQNSNYHPLDLYNDNMVITAAPFRKNAWEGLGGYKPGIGYEDWEYWLTLAENGHWGTLIPEPLFKYRTSIQSRFIEDKEVHWSNIRKLRDLHPAYRKTVSKLIAQRRYHENYIDADTAFINVEQPNYFLETDKHLPNILISIPWMTFGGAETLIYNYCREIKDRYNISFVTGLPSKHEWEYKFREITPAIYHLHNLFQDDKKLYLEFLSYYIKTRDIQILNIIHNGFTFEFLAELKHRHPQLKVVVTMFNDRVEYFKQSVKYESHIDTFVSDNESVASHYQRLLTSNTPTQVIPNGINCFEEFSPALFDRQAQRNELGILDGELAVFFVGRLSPEKNPDVFVKVAQQIGTQNKSAKLRFFIVGDGPMRAEIDTLIASKKTPGLTYLGYQSNVAKYLSAADIFVLPSSIEGFPLSIIEAMAMKAAVVASDVGAIAEVLDNGKNGFVVTPGSVGEIKATILKLEKDRQLLDRVKISARLKAEQKYSNRVLGDNYNNLYSGLLLK